MFQNPTTKIFSNVHEKGFTLLETLLAITVLVIALGGPLSIAQQGLSAAFVSRDQVTAYFLAQEALEYVRKIRDSNGIVSINVASTDWLVGMSSCVSGVCRIDPLRDQYTTACGVTCPRLKYDTTNHTYNYNAPSQTNVETNFTREVRIRQVANPECSNCEVIVSITVFWQTRKISKTMTITDHLFNWQQQ